MIKLISKNSRTVLKLMLMGQYFLFTVILILIGSERFRDLGLWLYFITIVLLFGVGLSIKTRLRSVDLLKAARDARNEEGRISQLNKSTKLEYISFLKWQWWRYFVLGLTTLISIFFTLISLWSLIYDEKSSDMTYELIIMIIIYPIIPIVTWSRLSFRTIKIVPEEEDEWPEIIQDLTDKMH